MTSPHLQPTRVSAEAANLIKIALTKKMNIYAIPGSTANSWSIRLNTASDSSIREHLERRPDLAFHIVSISEVHGVQPDVSAYTLRPDQAANRFSDLETWLNHQPDGFIDADVSTAIEHALTHGAPFQMRYYDRSQQNTEAGIPWPDYILVDVHTPDCEFDVNTDDLGNHTLDAGCKNIVVMND